MEDKNVKRLWNTNTKKFIEEFAVLQTVNSDGNIEHTYFERNPKTLELERLSTCHIEEQNCSGLKDKYGKLIYEGDILELYVSSKKLYRYEVKYEIGSFMLVSQDEIFDFPNVWNDNVYPLSQLYYEYQNEENYIDECEIIGNIYENPELLKEVE